MDQISPADIAERVRYWIDESRYLLADAVPTIVSEHEELKTRLKVVEEEGGRLRDENVSLQVAMHRLREDHDKLSREYAEVVEKLSRFTGQMTELLGPMSELARHIRDQRPAES